MKCRLYQQYHSARRTRFPGYSPERPSGEPKFPISHSTSFWKLFSGWSSIYILKGSPVTMIGWSGSVHPSKWDIIVNGSLLPTGHAEVQHLARGSRNSIRQQMLLGSPPKRMRSRDRIDAWQSSNMVKRNSHRR